MTERQLCNKYLCTWQKIGRNGRKMVICQSQIIEISLYLFNP